MGYPFWTYGGLLVQDQSETTQLIDYDRMYTPYKSTNPPPFLLRTLYRIFRRELRHRATALIRSVVVRFCVAACMAHVPEFRPNMTELEENILQNINADWTTKETEPEKKFSIRELLSEPAP